MWFKEAIQNKIFSLLFLLALLIFIVLLVKNLFFQKMKTGTYTDYTQSMFELLNVPLRKNERKKMDFITKYDENKYDNKFESKGELECRRAIENLTNRSFPKARPQFLLNEVSGHKLELDCYNEDLKIAVEYNGEQHYKYIPYFHNSKEAFYNLKYRDLMKEKLCKENGVKLIVVPYTIKHKDIEKYLYEQLIV